MDMNVVMQMVATLGFPIVACIGMGWFVYDNTKKHRDEVSKLNEQHKEEMSQVTTALNNNTLALQRLCDKMDGNVKL